ncbi:MAG: C40 family peptidase [candidate division KSB1 bacterium]|nr:C40 family peptidase [candidate division KSB1 bacterium]
MLTLYPMHDPAKQQLRVLLPMPIIPLAMLFYAICSCSSALPQRESFIQSYPPLQPPQIELLKQEIRRYYQVPYRWGGSTEEGMDCSGFVSTLYRNALGVSLPRTVAELYAYCLPIPARELAFGDLVFFGETGRPAHVGLYLQKGYFIDAGRQKGVGLNKLSDSYYRRRYMGAGRVRVVEGS